MGNTILVISEMRCCAVVCLSAAAATAVIYSLMGILIERIYATVAYKTYEKNKSKIVMVLLATFPVVYLLSML